MANGVYHWFDPAELAELPEGTVMVEVLRDRWWLANEEGKIGFYQGVKEPRRTRYNMPQCNTDRRITDIILKNHPDTYSAVFVPVVFIKHNCSDYH